LRVLPENLDGLFAGRGVSCVSFGPRDHRTNSSSNGTTTMTTLSPFFAHRYHVCRSKTIAKSPSHSKRWYDLRWASSPTFSAGWLLIKLRTVRERGVGKVHDLGWLRVRGGCGDDGTPFLSPVRENGFGALKSYAEAGAPRPSREPYDGGEGWFYAERATVAAVQADDNTPRRRPPWTSAYVDITHAHSLTDKVH